MDRLARQWHMEQPLPELPAHMAPEVARLTEFIVMTPCALHDAQNTFKWGLHDQCSDSDLMRDIFVSIESLRNSADLITRYLGECVDRRLREVGDRGQAWVDSQMELRCALGMDSELTEMLASTLQLCFENGELRVSRSASGLVEGDFIEALSTTLMQVWKWVKLSTSRWLTVGTSAWFMVASLSSLVWRIWSSTSRTTPMRAFST